jgi:hypothetical protein
MDVRQLSIIEQRVGFNCHLVPHTFCYKYYLRDVFMFQPIHPNKCCPWNVAEWFSYMCNTV